MVEANVIPNASAKLDTSDVDQCSEPVVFAEMYDFCNATDIRRTVQAMDHPNPLHRSEELAKKSATVHKNQNAEMVVRERASWPMATAH
jgi:hypothetical protein